MLQKCNAKRPPTAQVLHSCGKCKKVFSRKDNLTQHLKTCKGPVEKTEKSTECNTCGKVFSNVSNLRKHMAGRCRGPAPGPAPEPENIQAGEGTSAQVPSKLACSKCGRIYLRVDNLKRHEDTCVPKEFKCQLCPAVFNKMTLLYHHRRDVHPGETVAKSKSSLDKKRKKSQKSDNAVKRQRMENGEPIRRDTANLVIDPENFDHSLMYPDTPDKDEHDEKLLRKVEENWNYIRSHSHHGRFEDRHVIRLSSSDLRDIYPQLRQLFENQTTKFRINLSFGSVM